MPMVVMNDGVKESSLKRSRQQDLPTPESPMRRSLICARFVSGGKREWAGEKGKYQEVIVAGSGHRCGGCGGGGGGREGEEDNEAVVVVFVGSGLGSVNRIRSRRRFHELGIDWHEVLASGAEWRDQSWSCS